MRMAVCCCMISKCRIFMATPCKCRLFQSLRGRYVTANGLGRDLTPQLPLINT
jgi:hypothetical protein